MTVVAKEQVVVVAAWTCSADHFVKTIPSTEVMDSPPLTFKDPISLQSIFLMLKMKGCCALHVLDFDKK
jgi:hypothetical protein